MTMHTKELTEASPRLLELVQSMYAILDDQCDFDLDSPIMVDARDAIAEATGTKNAPQDRA